MFGEKDVRHRFPKPSTTVESFGALIEYVSPTFMPSPLIGVYSCQYPPIGGPPYLFAYEQITSDQTMCQYRVRLKTPYLRL